MRKSSPRESETISTSRTAEIGHAPEADDGRGFGHYRHAVDAPRAGDDDFAGAAIIFLRGKRGSPERDAEAERGGKHLHGGSRFHRGTMVKR